MKILRLALPILIASAVSAQTSAPLLDGKVLDLLHESLSGELAKEYVIGITRHHRIQGSRGYRDAAQYVLGELKRFGFGEKDAYIESFPSDGKIHYQTWQSPSGWDISSAELRMVEPYDERIVGYPEVAMSLMTYSNPGDVTAELVWVGGGTSEDDYKGRDVKGKFVLATGYGGAVHRLAVLKYNAKAVVCYLDDERAAEYPDMLQYTGMWPKTSELEATTFGFNLTNRQGEKLRGLLLSGKKVTMRGWAKGTGLEPYAMDVVVAHIRGTDNASEELVFSAHLDHPKESANDNASGSAAILDIARSLKELTDSGRLPRPKRSFTFIWVPEWNGTMAWIDAHPGMKGPELGGSFLANMNMDMVGENPELLHSKLILTRTPLSLPSCVNDVVENMAQAVDRLDVRTPRGSLSEFNYRVTPYSGGSDHMMFIDRKVPGVMFSHTDYTHHTSEDTPDKVDPVELERCEIISAGTMWYLANLDDTQGVDLARLAYANALGRFGMEVRRAHAMGPPSPSGAVDLNAAQNVIDYGYWDARQSVGSVLSFNGAENVKYVVNDLFRRLETGFREASVMPSALYPGTSSPPKKQAGQAGKVARVPVRTTRGPLDFGLPESALSPADAQWYGTPAFTISGDQRFELVNFIDGRRSVSEIRNAVSAYGAPVDVSAVYRYLEDLVKANVLKWAE
ncbi:MAG TPA: M28 family peptidase [Bacteroidota bacterium]|nr:M28 family peptidase [Bacteroidota bacterium]